MGGISRRTFNILRKLCGKDSLSNVLIVTNMWDDPPSPVQLMREAELQDHPDFFQPALEQGATMVRRPHKDARSARDIIRLLLQKEPVVLEIQQELVDQKKTLSDTGAGREVEKDLIMATEHHKAEMDELKQDMETALRERDERTQKELIEWQNQAKAAEEKRRTELESLKQGYTDEQTRWHKQIEEARAERQAAEVRQQVMQEELEMRRRQQQETDEHQRHELQKRIADLEHRVANPPPPPCVIM